MNPAELGFQTLLTPAPLLLQLLLLGLWQGPQEGIRVRVGPGLGRGGWEGAHLVRSAQRAGTAWQGLVSCAGSKEMEKEVGRGEAGQILAAHTHTHPTSPPGSREQTVLWSPQGTFESKTVRAERNSAAHPTPLFYSGKNRRLREFQQSAQGHTASKAEKG